MMTQWKGRPHRRYNPLTGEWVLVSPHRTARPWQGQVEPAVVDARPSYDPTCYLCPGNTRAGGAVNPPYQSTFAFTNDFSALLPEESFGNTGSSQNGPLFRCQHVAGTCRVLCFSPRHDATLGELSHAEIGQVIEAWIAQTRELGAQYRWVQIFENKGAMMGASNPHPHGQIWASDFLPSEPAKEDRQQAEYLATYGRRLLIDYLEAERSQKIRILGVNETWAAVVPFWAVWPFEALLLPRRPRSRLEELDDQERQDLALIVQQLVTAYDRLFGVPFPYSMGWHGAPYGMGDAEHWQLHAHFYPPLLRSSTVRKFMVGFELLSEAQRDLTAEQAAERLRSLWI